MGAARLGRRWPADWRGHLTDSLVAYRPADERGDGDEAFELAVVLAEQNRLAEAEEAFARADQRGHPEAATKLGMLLEERGDFARAAAAYRRADERGDAMGAFELAILLAGEDELTEAEEALERADQRGHGAAAYNLGVLLEHRREMSAAEAAYRRADERGVADGAFELGMLLAAQKRLGEAEEALARADQRGHAASAAKLGMLLEQRGEIAGATAAYRRADERGDARGAFELAMLLADQNRLDEAEEALARADQRGHAAAAHNLGLLLEERGDVIGAAAAYQRADERGLAEGAFELGMLLAGADRLGEAEDAFASADERGHPTAAAKLGALLNSAVTSPALPPHIIVPTSAAMPTAHSSSPCSSPARTCLARPKTRWHARPSAGTPTPLTTSQCCANTAGVRSRPGRITRYRMTLSLGELAEPARAGLDEPDGPGELSHDAAREPRARVGFVDRIRPSRRLGLMLLVPIVGIAAAVVLSSHGGGSRRLHAGHRRTDDAGDWRADDTRDQRHFGHVHRIRQGPTQAGRRPQAGSYQDLDITRGCRRGYEDGQYLERRSRLGTEPDQHDGADECSVVRREHHCGSLEPARVDPERPEPPHHHGTVEQQHRTDYRRISHHRVREQLYPPDRTKCR